MPLIQLTPAQRKVHRSEAHHLDPVVMVGGDGLTDAVKKEADAALNAHGLIKIRVFSDDRAAREAMLLGALDNKNGPARDIVAFNAGASIYVAGLADTLADGVKKALATLASSAARKKLDQFVAHTSALKQ